MTNVTFALQEKVEVHCVYMPDAILTICRMSLLFQKIMKVHCVYMPDAIQSICRMLLVLTQKTMKVHCVDGCHSVYMLDVTFVCL